MTTSARSLDALLDEAPFVTALARALARDDAEDIVQGTWLRALESNPSAARDPRGWLACIVRGVVRNRHRSEARRQARERSAARPGSGPSTAELVERQELRRALLDAVEALPTAQRTVVLLRHFENLPPRRIAAHLGLPVTTVTSRLRTAHATLRQRLDARHGSRQAWLLTLVPVRGSMLASAGALAVAFHTKALLGIVAVVIAGLALWSFGDPAVGVQPTGDESGSPPPLMTGESGESRTGGALARERAAGAVRKAALDPTTGTLVVRVVHASDRAPVADIVVLAQQPGAGLRVGRRRARTDARGVARIERLTPGQQIVTNARSTFVNARVDVVAGVTTEVEFELPAGVTITGTVVDRFDVPVAGAEVCLGGAGVLQDAEPATTTGSDGRFELRCCDLMTFVAARAAGHVSSKMEFVNMTAGSARDLRLVLPGAGGSVAGVVRDHTGKPVADAVVVVGDRTHARLDTTTDGHLRAIARTDDQGRYRAIGLRAGEHPVQVRSALHAPWTGSCHVEANLDTALDVRLDRAMACVGVVLAADGTPVAGAKVEVGEWDAFAYFRTRSSADGAFRLDGLPPGELEVKARENVAGDGRQVVRGGAGETVRCDVRLSAGLTLRGRVTSAKGDPVAEALVDVTSSDRSWGRWRQADSNGEFAVPQCPADGNLTVTVTAPGFEKIVIESADPRRGDLTVQLTDAPTPSSFLVGTVLTADGLPAPQLEIQGRAKSGASSGLCAGDATGRFSIGPLPTGTWSLWIRAPDLPSTWTAWREVAADETLDLGTIRVPRAGTIRVRLRDSGDLRPTITASDATLAHWTGFRGGDGKERRSRPLAPGPHLVAISGPGVAAQLIPVEVREGEETSLDVQVQRGWPQRFEVVAPAPMQERHVRIEQARRLVAGWSAIGRRREHARPDFQRDLAPGDYVIIVRGDGMSGERRFTVGKDGNRVVRIMLR